MSTLMMVSTPPPHFCISEVYPSKAYWSTLSRTCLFYMQAISFSWVEFVQNLVTENNVQNQDMKIQDGDVKNISTIIMTNLSVSGWVLS